jgi:hypothetical protein
MPAGNTEDSHRTMVQVIDLRSQWDIDISPRCLRGAFLVEFKLENRQRESGNVEYVTNNIIYFCHKKEMSNSIKNVLFPLKTKLPKIPYPIEQAK